jgi:hypothetical protein
MKKETAVDFLVKEVSAILGPINTEPIQDMLLVAAIEKAKEMEIEQKNDLPIHIHEGISNTKVYIENGIVNVKPNDLHDSKNPWLSPIESERKWQEEKLVEIFYHYPNASPKWQYMNGLIQIALEHIKQNKE